MHSKHDYIPAGDADFNIWQGNFLSALEARQAALGLTDAELNALRAENEAWEGDYAEHVTKQAAAASASRAKSDRRVSYQRSLRACVQRVQAHPSITDADRAALGITVRSATRTAPPAPSTRPVVRVDTSQRFRHTLHVTDESAQNSRAKPPGVSAYEIWGTVSDTPVSDLSQMTYLGYATATPYVIEYTAAAAGKMANYALRWVNSRGDKGPWSRTVSATVSA